MGGPRTPMESRFTFISMIRRRRRKWDAWFHYCLRNPFRVLCCDFPPVRPHDKKSCGSKRKEWKTNTHTHTHTHTLWRVWIWWKKRSRPLWPSFAFLLSEVWGAWVIGESANGELPKASVAFLPLTRLTHVNIRMKGPQLFAFLLSLRILLKCFSKRSLQECICRRLCTFFSPINIYNRGRGRGTELNHAQLRALLLLPS